MIRRHGTICRFPAVQENGLFSGKDNLALRLECVKWLFSKKKKKKRVCSRDPVAREQERSI